MEKWKVDHVCQFFTCFVVRFTESWTTCRHGLFVKLMMFWYFPIMIWNCTLTNHECSDMWACPSSTHGRKRVPLNFWAREMTNWQPWCFDCTLQLYVTWILIRTYYPNHYWILVINMMVIKKTRNNTGEWMVLTCLHVILNSTKIRISISCQWMILYNTFFTTLSGIYRSSVMDKTKHVVYLIMLALSSRPRDGSSLHNACSWHIYI